MGQCQELTFIDWYETHMLTRWRLLIQYLIITKVSSGA
jgi:hypothetical protein